MHAPGQFVGTASGGAAWPGPVTNTIIRSDDGARWSRVYSEIVSGDLWCWAEGGGIGGIAVGWDRFVAIGIDTILVSTDGLHWFKKTWDQAPDLYQIVYGNGQFVAATGGDNVATGGTKLYSSRDGIHWRRLAVNFDPSPYGLIGFADGYFTSVGEGRALQSGPVIALGL